MHYAWYLILTPVLAVIVGGLICKWAEAIDEYKMTGDALKLIVMVIGTICCTSLGLGLYLLLS